jgi:uncharacterized repeat protein (TIGR01451 family)
MKNHSSIFKCIFISIYCVITSQSFAQTIAAGENHSMAICSDGTVQTWGSNEFGQLGNGTFTNSNNPFQVANLSEVNFITAGENYSMVLQNDGSLWTWGHNLYGQLGDGTITNRNIPVQIAGTWTSIAAGYAHSIGIKSDGSLWTWGNNLYGQLGDGTTTNSNNPVQIEGSWISIAAGGLSSFGIKTDGTLWAWGDNGSGQLGVGNNTNSNVPIQIIGSWTSIFSKGPHTLGIKTDGTLWAWGGNTQGQIGNGTNTNSTIPLQIDGNWTSIALGRNHTLGLKADGSLWAWGLNINGQLGDGTNTNRNIPTQIEDSWVSISAGFYHSLGLKMDGSLWTWGLNNYGQLGDGTNSDSYIPVQNLQSCEVQHAFNLKGALGHTFIDLNENCNLDLVEQVITNKELYINPGNIILQSNINGYWHIDSLPAGNYTITIDTSNTNWTVTCPITQSFIVVHPDSLTIAPSFGMVSNNPCPSPTVSVNMPFMRPCFTNQQVYVHACNEYDATGVLPDAYSIVELDPNLIFENASLPYTSLGNNQYRFQHDTLFPGECVNYTISTQVNCDAPLGLTLCTEANLYPVAACVLDTIPTPPTGEVTPCTLPWDQSSLSVEGWCANDSIYFTITNTGEFGGGDMECYSPIRIYVDGAAYLLDSIKLLGGETFTYVFLGTGQTWILEADQHPLHPGNSHPNAHVENCNPGNWTPELVNVFPQDDADPVKDIFCGIVTGSYDPNDKRGFPLGLTEDHEIFPNQDLEYIIRFQNTGTDTAFNIVVRDTLDLDFDIFSVTSGVASHTYTFRMYGPRVLEWTFPNILLPDSTTNEPLSNGFLSFKVKQKPNLSDGTLFTNDADIYFDFNEPIITNETSHKVQRRTFEPTNSLTTLSKTKSTIRLYPNPTKQETTLSFTNYQKQVAYKLLNLSGQVVLEKANLYGKEVKVNLSEVPNGMYLLEVKTEDGSERLKVVRE